MRGGAKYCSYGNQVVDKEKGMVASYVKTTYVHYSLPRLSGLPKLWFLCGWNLNLTHRSSALWNTFT